MKKSEIKQLIKEVLNKSVLPVISDSDKIKIKKEKLESADGDIMDTDTYRKYEYKFIKSYPEFNETRYKAWVEGDDDGYDIVAQKLIDKAYKEIKKQLKTAIKENTTFGDKLAAHDKKIKQYQDFYFELKSNLMNKYGYEEEDMEDETIENKINREADDLFYKKFKIKYQDVLNPFQIKENQSYKGTITDDSAEYILKDLGFKLQHQYDSITGTRFFGTLDQLQKARRELKLKYDIESTISGYGRFAYKELHIPNQTVD